GLLQAQLYLFEGLGVDAQGDMGYLQAHLANNQTPSSLVTAWSLAGVIRLYLGAGAAARELQLRGGWGSYQFRLEGVPFPGVALEGPYGGLHMILPVGTHVLALILGADYRFGVKASGDTLQLGQPRGGWGVAAQAGARLTFGSWELTGTYGWEQYNVPFTGPTSLAQTAAQWSDVKLVDTAQGFRVMLGKHYD
ncbi:MAG TPA: hypothetical protein VFH51_18575, partial [Myxococcota bacterium]|nr:hypothetical protein [Myxococcota bacterium]